MYEEIIVLTAVEPIIPTHITEYIRKKTAEILGLALWHYLCEVIFLFVVFPFFLLEDGHYRFLDVISGKRYYLWKEKKTYCILKILSNSDKVVKV